MYWFSYQVFWNIVKLDNVAPFMTDPPSANSRNLKSPACPNKQSINSIAW